MTIAQRRDDRLPSTAAEKIHHLALLSGVMVVSIVLVACSDGASGTLDARFAATMAAVENAARDKCSCIEDPQSGTCEANPADCSTTMQECLQHWVLDADYGDCLLLAMKTDEAKSRTLLGCLDVAIAELQRCIDESSCGPNLGDCEEAYMGKNLSCFELLGNDVFALIRKCDNQPPEDLTKPGLDGGAS